MANQTTNKDWLGNTKSTFTTIGASNHSEYEREENDYYATDPMAAEWLLKLEPELNMIWECACGEGHLAKVFNEHGKLGFASDLIDRGYGAYGVDFLNKEPYSWDGDIVTNPPYKYAKEFVEQAIKSVHAGRKVCMFLKLTFLEGKAHQKFFKQYPPKTLYVSSSRINCARNGDFKSFTSSAMAYGWYVWEKGYAGETQVKWFN